MYAQGPSSLHTVSSNWIKAGMCQSLSRQRYAHQAQSRAMCPLIRERSGEEELSVVDNLVGEPLLRMANELLLIA